MDEEYWLVYGERANGAPYTEMVWGSAGDARKHGKSMGLVNIGVMHLREVTVR